MKTIAERNKKILQLLNEWKNNDTYDEAESVQELINFFDTRNQRTYSIQEVEQIARDAVANADMNSHDDCADFNAYWWQQKKESLIKGE